MANGSGFDLPSPEVAFEFEPNAVRNLEFHALPFEATPSHHTSTVCPHSSTVQLMLRALAEMACISGSIRDTDYTLNERPFT
jgi:hypothetical protein